MTSLHSSVLGCLNFFLGIEIHQLPNGDILLNQSKYVRDLSIQDKIDYSTPIATSCPSVFLYLSTMVILLIILHSIIVLLVHCSIQLSLILISHFVINRVCLYMAKPSTTTLACC